MMKEFKSFEMAEPKAVLRNILDETMIAMSSVDDSPTLTCKNKAEDRR